MSVRATVFQGTQWGVETTPGTPVAASKRAQNTRIILDPETRVQPVAAMGGRHDIGVNQAKEYCLFNIQADKIGWEDHVYLLVAALKAGTASPFTFNPGQWASEAIKTLTVETGYALRAERIAYAIVSGLRFRFTETECSLSGDGFGRIQTDGVTITASPTALSPLVLSPKNTTVLVGSSIGGLAAITLPYETEIGWTGWRKPIFGLNADTSFTDAVEGKPQVTARMVMEYGSQAAGYMADLRASTQKFLRIINTDGTRTLQITMPFNFGKNKPGDTNDTWAANFDLLPDYESGADFGIEIVSTVPSLTSL